MNVIECMEAIEAAPRGNARLAEICAQIEVGNTEVTRMFTDTLDAFKTFGIQAVSMPTSTWNGIPTAEIEFCHALFTLGAELAARKLTGLDARDAIQRFLNWCDPLREKWARRYLLRDLRLDVGAKALNKVFGKDFIPLFEVPLAEPHDKVKPKIFTEGGWVWQPKLDGARCVAFVDGAGQVSLKSRTGKPWKNFETIRMTLEHVARTVGLTNHVFDGEVVSLDADGYIDFQALQKTMQRRDGVEIGRLVYVMFDSADAAEWQRASLMYGERYANVSVTLGTGMNPLQGQQYMNIGGDGFVECWGPGDRLCRVPQVNYIGQDLMEMCKAYVDQGYEGGMLRRADVPVIMKRSRALIKVKTFKDTEAVCIGLTEGEGKRAGKLGALVLQWKPGITFKCGSGLSDAKLAELTADPPIGKKITVKFFETTDDGMPRFPIFKCVRVAEDLPKEEDDET